MKKKLTLIVLSVLMTFAGYAQTLKIINQSPSCAVSFYVRAMDAYTTVSCGDHQLQVSIPAGGSVTYSGVCDPSIFWQTTAPDCTTGAWVTGTDVVLPVGTGIIRVGNPTYCSTVTTSGSLFPDCTGSATISSTWTTSLSGDVTLLVY